jgi:hypothetical protein
MLCFFLFYSIARAEHFSFLDDAYSVQERVLQAFGLRYGFGIMPLCGMMLC